MTNQILTEEKIKEVEMFRYLRGSVSWEIVEEIISSHRAINERCKQHVVENDNQNAEIEMRKKYENFLQCVIRSGEYLQDEQGFDWFKEMYEKTVKEYAR